MRPGPDGLTWEVLSAGFFITAWRKLLTSPLDRRENLFGARILVSSKDTPCAVGRGEKPTERSSLRVGEAFEKLSLVRRRCRREPKTESSFAC